MFDGPKFMESPLSIFRMHWDHEPEMHKCLEINERISRFMESPLSLLKHVLGP